MARSFPGPPAFLSQIDRLDQELQRQALKITRQMADKAKDHAIDEASRDLRGDPEFSGWQDFAGRGLQNLRVRPLRSNAGQWVLGAAGSHGHIVVPSRKAAGPWTVVQFGRNQGNASGFAGPGLNMKTGRTSYTGKIDKQGYARIRRRSFRQKRWNGYTTGYGTASRAVDKAERDAERIAETSARPIIRKYFDVT